MRSLAVVVGYTRFMPTPPAGLALFDAGASPLSPICDTRAAFDARTGALTNRERLERYLGRRAAAVLAPEALAEALKEQADGALVNTLPAGESLLFVNGALVIPDEELRTLAPGEALLDEATSAVVAAHLGPAEARAFAESFELPASVSRRRPGRAAMLQRIWDVIRLRDAAIAHDLEALLAERASQRLRKAPTGAQLVGDRPIAVAPSATIYPGAFLIAERGPIVIDEDAVIRPGAVIRGPAFIGAGSHILEHALIKENTAIGPTCRIAGEVGGAIAQGCSNKAHAGHLGDAWIGQWVNLGAGTTNSNLLNTYGEVSMPIGPDDPSKQPTGMRFLGCIVGDHAKLAIETRIMTGSAIGVGAMIATTAPPPLATPTFAWLTDAGLQAHRWERFAATARAMMDRRGHTLSPAQERLLRHLHARALTRLGGGA